MNWVFKKFNQLTLNEFHSILKLRIDVFIVEQNCPYHELDELDKKAYHLFIFSKTNPKEIKAYSRIFKQGDYFKEAAIGRVVVQKKYRDTGLGYELMEKSIEKIENVLNSKNIKIGAQTYLRSFYESLGFKKTGKDYIEDGIPHIYMIKEIKQ